MLTKTIVLLANSRKHSERCLAGRELINNNAMGWIRPVSAREGEGLNSMERMLFDRSEPKPLDVIRVPLHHANPHSCQTENWLVADSHWWVKQGTLTWDEAAAIAEHPAVLWVNGFRTYNGLNDEIPLERAQGLTSSICMIRVPLVEVKVITSFDKKKVRIEFEHRGVRYNFSLTDSEWEPYFKAQANGNYAYQDCLLTVSLSEPFTKNDGSVCQYKLVAAMIPHPGV